VQVAMLGALEVRAGSGEVIEVGGTRLRVLLPGGTLADKRCHAKSRLSAREL
jgi:hypothetical protein